MFKTNYELKLTKLGKRVKARGDSEFAANDFDNMPYLVAVGKETLRIHPPVVEIPRVAWNDDIIPLSKPVLGVSGKVYAELAIPRRTMVVVSPLGHNLNPTIWGADAYEWRPERWLETAENPKTSVGVYGNLVIGIHTFLVTLIRQFEFALPYNAPKVRRWRPGLVIPVIEGEEHKGTQLPLRITPLKNI
ncbi:cytochrome P450 [Thelephora ganbajun]|uniref:Cytochrome P450 n=1 Tax=Thelephora ganbajun TaxID=370292 RepID=A0ACB6ZBQ3_THEGA|nr:cytochrome P450 [Thelephora ganbajun]